MEINNALTVEQIYSASSDQLEFRTNFIDSKRVVKAVINALHLSDTQSHFFCRKLDSQGGGQWWQVHDNFILVKTEGFAGDQCNRYSLHALSSSEPELLFTCRSCHDDAEPLEVLNRQAKNGLIVLLENNLYHMSFTHL